MLLRLCLVLASAVPSTLRADEIRLDGEARLSGSVLSIEPSGAVNLESPLSPGTIVLKPGAVSKIEFVPGNHDAAPSTSLVELANGDLLPATVESLDTENLIVTPANSSRMVIPRKMLRSLQLGVRSRKVIYSGPNSLAEWHAGGDDGHNWTFSNKRLVASGSARAFRDIEVPRQFIFKCSLKWQGSPSFRISFADPVKGESGPVDRYFFEFNPSGFEIRRESSTGRRYHTVIASTRTPDQFPSATVDVEIRVDRNSSRLELLLNGEPEGTGIDPLTQLPSAGGIALVNSGPSGSNQEISGIEIAEFDNTRARHRAEDRGDTSVDSLISREDDRWGGHLTSIRSGGVGEGGVFTFRSDFQQEPLELAEKDVSTIFFASPGSTEATAAGGAFILRLRGEGSLRVDSCSFSGEVADITHPLLGAMKILRGGISALERPKEKSPTPEEP